MPLTAEQINDRQEIIWDSDAVCLGCGADPRGDDDGEAAIADPRWFMDLVACQEQGDTFEGPFQYDGMDYEAIVRCPKCW